MRTLAATPYSCCAYGYNIVSDMPFVSLMTGADPALETITIHRCDTLPDAPSDARALDPFSVAGTNYLSLDIEMTVRFAALNGDTILYLPYDDVSATSFQVFLLVSGLGALLIQCDLFVLHGNAIELEGASMMCVGTIWCR